MAQGTGPLSSVGEAELVRAMEAALAGRRDLECYVIDGHDNRRMLFALELHTKTEDIHGIAADALVDGMNDKSIDVLYVDRDRRLAVLMQGYEGTSTRAGLPTAKSKDFFQALSWALAEGTEPLPRQIAAAVKDLRDALEDRAIDCFEVWFVHNRPEGRQVQEEIEQARAATVGLISQWTRKDGTPILVEVRQVGQRTLAAWYDESQTPIRVTGSESVDISGYFIEAGSSWRFLAATVPAAWLAGLYWAHGTKLFSANVRDFLGDDSPINAGIQETARQFPDQLCVRNLGVTILVNSFELGETVDGLTPLTVNGLSIINGAQTVGSIQGLGKDVGGRLLVRFVECDRSKLVTELIRSNNRQNPTEPMDFHSNDAVQRRLATEFHEQYGIGYDGARRRAADSIAAKNRISSSTMARILTAFHLSPAIAHYSPRSVWEVSADYAQVFPSRSSAAHLHFCYTLFEAVRSRRKELVNDEGDADLVTLCNQPGASWLFISAVGRTMQTILGRSAAGRTAPFDLCFDRDAVATREAAVTAWLDLLRPLLWQARIPLSEVYAVRGGLKDDERVAAKIEAVRDSIRMALDSRHSTFRSDCEAFAQLLAPATA